MSSHSCFPGRVRPTHVRASARRGRRCAQGPAGGSCCDGRRFSPTPLCCSLWDPAPNSLRSLRSLRSNRRGEVSCGCALRAPIPETALLAVTEIAPRRPLRAAPAARQQWLTSSQGQHAALRLVRRSPSSRQAAAEAESALTFRRGKPVVASAAGGTRRGRFLERRAAQAWRRRAQRASKTDSPRLFERNERSEWSEFAARRQAEQHSGVGAQRRPLQHEPPPGTARRAAQSVAVVNAMQSTK
jgi:hypothetical protein